MKVTRRTLHVNRTLYRKSLYWTNKLTQEQNANLGKGTKETAATANKWRGLFVDHYYKIQDSQS